MSILPSGSSIGGGGGVAPPTVGYSPYPNQQIAPLTNQQLQGMGMVSDLTHPLQNYLQGNMDQAGQFAGQTGNVIGGQNQFTGNYFNQGLPGQNQLANQYNQSGAGMVSNIMQGGMMSPQDNQYLQQYYHAAADPLIDQYKQTTAPNILQSAAQSGTLGSQGTQQAFKNAEEGLAEGLGNLGAGIYSQAYGQNLNAMTGLLGQSMQTAQNVYGQQQLGAENALGALGGAAQAAQQFSPNFTNAMYGIPQQLMSSGATGQNQAQNILTAGYGNLNNQAQWPFQAIQTLLGAVPVAGQQGTTVGKQPNTSTA